MSNVGRWVELQLWSHEEIFAHILKEHRYEQGFMTNCICDAPGIWTWQDWIDHVAPLLADEAGE